ncbi:ABC transporter permease [Candidatus Protochlamydia phocaeensis]|uniref:ABC transporter permease n=1 Tax=Candidatus Protochlamydia phocaeensis TaxID=1414722 RepID=UPI000838CA7D|nr:ABC-2 family transporter protein [Candidatus Protochlamydia phocaeensis]
MKAYLAIFKCRLSALFQYRLAAFAGLSTQIFWGFVKMMILQAFYAHALSPPPISLPQAITFVWLGQALLQLLPWNIDREIEAQVRTGNVAYELVRPIDVYGLWFVRSLALRFIPTLMRSLPLFLVAGLFFGLSMPASASAGIFFSLSLFCSMLLSAAMTTLVVISLFWTISGEGILRLLPHLTMILSGMVVPLPLFPDWMQPFLSIQPFRGIIDIPVRLYTGIIPPAEGLFYLGFQLAWFAFFVVLGRALMHQAMKRIIIQGG